ncbi:WD40 repeat-like protein [Aspergillus phoenicis ATCC 13157]|uniref:Mitochondrial division protein 1 n=1 Tax=Aspergillus phoenicis ATCC 13157 TaxID=1353007 RepID=A0A370PZH8_ASPPH|nr:WD40 repeat-like protein [Aspergillus phoenicis ATCC 13157]
MGTPSAFIYDKIYSLFGSLKTVIKGWKRNKYPHLVALNLRFWQIAYDELTESDSDSIVILFPLTGNKSQDAGYVRTTEILDEVVKMTETYNIAKFDLIGYASSAWVIVFFGLMMAKNYADSDLLICCVFIEEYFYGDRDPVMSNKEKDIYLLRKKEAEAILNHIDILTMDIQKAYDAVEMLNLSFAKGAFFSFFKDYGMAGTGKSTIARMVARLFEDDGIFGVSFFFKRNPGESMNSIVIVIDVLDECEPEEDVEIILNLLSKVEIRPESPIREERIEVLVMMAFPLFILAATVCRFVADRHFDLDERLWEISTSPAGSKMDKIYWLVLNQLLKIIGVIILLANPLSLSSLAELLETPECHIRIHLDLFHSVLTIPSDSKLSIQTLHLSFHDYLVNECTKEIDSDFIARFFIPVLQYACCYWVLTFLKEHFLHWFEVMGILGMIYEAKDSVNSFSGLIFAPYKVLIREIFEKELSAWLCRGDGQLLASGSDDNIIKLWDVATGVLKYTLEGYSSWVNFVAFSGDSQLLASSSDNNIIKLWDTRTGAFKYILKSYSGWINFVTFSGDDQLLASGSDDNTIKLWDAATGTLKYTLEGYSGWINFIVFSGDGQLLASSLNDNTIKLWDAATGTLKYILKSYSGWVKSAIFSGNGQLLASGSNDNTIKLWDVVTGTSKHILEGYFDWIKLLVFSGDGQLLASSSYDKTIKLWDAAAGALKHTLACYSVATNIGFSDHLPLLITNIGSFNIQICYEPFSSKPSKKVTTLWLSFDYKPSSSAVRDSIIALGSTRGRVAIIAFSVM